MSGINKWEKKGSSKNAILAQEFYILCPLIGAEGILEEEEDRNELWRVVRGPPQIFSMELNPRIKEMLLVATLFQPSTILRLIKDLTKQSSKLQT
jgi:hypothetical protein